MTVLEEPLFYYPQATRAAKAPARGARTAPNGLPSPPDTSRPLCRRYRFVTLRIEMAKHASTSVVCSVSWKNTKIKDKYRQLLTITDKLSDSKVMAQYPSPYDGIKANDQHKNCETRIDPGKLFWAIIKVGALFFDRQPCHL
jgi:hypothetical protein